MTDAHGLSEQETLWLMRLLRSRPRHGQLDQFTIPGDVHDTLVEKGLIHWRRRQVEITLDGIRAIGRLRPQVEE